jgi:hypothetical protein
MPDALTTAGWLEEIAAHLRAYDHPRADWFNEAIALTRTGTSLDAALGWSGYEIPLKQHTQTEALAAMVAAQPPGEASAAEISRQLAVARPEGPAAAYIAAGGPTSERAIRRRMAELAPANVSDDLAGGSVA